MPIIEEVIEQSRLSDRWFQPECHRAPEREITDWDSRHVALERAYVNHWTSNNKESSEWWSEDIDTTCRVTILRKSDDSIRDKHLDLSASNIVSIGLARRLNAEPLRVEFEALAKKWQRDTRHLSLISKKITHPAYFRIVGMGQTAIPLLLEALRDRPAHWFAALRATANTDPSPLDASPSVAREAWLKWGRSQGLVD